MHKLLIISRSASLPFDIFKQHSNNLKSCRLLERLILKRLYHCWVCFFTLWFTIVFSYVQKSKHKCIDFRKEFREILIIVMFWFLKLNLLAVSMAKVYLSTPQKSAIIIIMKRNSKLQRALNLGQVYWKKNSWFWAKLLVFSNQRGKASA